jgi:hypothetical protein
MILIQTVKYIFSTFHSYRGEEAMQNATVQEWNQLVAATRQAAPELQEVFDPLAAVLDLGLQVKVASDGQVKVAGLKDLSPEDARKAAQFVRDNADAIRLQVQAIEIFESPYPGFCAGCKAFAKNWPLTRKGVRHSQWCVFQAAFLGKSGRPIKIEWDPELPFSNRAKCPRRR